MKLPDSRQFDLTLLLLLVLLIAGLLALAGYEEAHANLHTTFNIPRSMP